MSGNDFEEEEYDEQEFEVEKILDFKYEKGMKYYLIKWKDYEESTWEPLSNLSGCIEMINDYHNNIDILNIKKDHSKLMVLLEKKGIRFYKTFGELSFSETRHAIDFFVQHIESIEPEKQIKNSQFDEDSYYPISTIYQTSNNEYIFEIMRNGKEYLSMEETKQQFPKQLLYFLTAYLNID